jgi:hypothetical protein
MVNTSTHTFWILILFCSSLLFSACSTTASLVDSEQPLLTDEDIEKATLELASQEAALRVIESRLSVAEETDVSNKIHEKSSSDINAQAVLPGVSGWLTYIRNIPSNTNPWRVMAQDQAVGTDVLIYKGKREIQSVAVDASGNVFIFAMRETTVTTSDFDVYRYVRSSATLTRLANNTVDDLNVSVSANGNTVVWESTNSTTSKRQIVIREYAGSTFTQSFLSNSLDQVEPTVSGDGQFIAYIRVFANNDKRVYLYNRTSLADSLVYTGGVNRDPSVSNAGRKIAWLRQGNPIRIRVKDTVTGATTVVASGTDYAHPHLSDNGNGLTYSNQQGGEWNIWTQSLISNAVELATSQGDAGIDRAPFCHCVFPTFWSVGFTGSVGTIGRTFGGSLDAGSDGSLYLALPEPQTSGGSAYFRVQKRTKEGALLWSRNAVLPAVANANSYLLDSGFGLGDNSLVTLGLRGYNNDPFLDFEIRKYDSNGTLTWRAIEAATRNNGLLSLVYHSVTIDGSGNVIAAALASYVFPNSTDTTSGVYIVKRNANGNIVWGNYYALTPVNSEAPISSAANVATDSAGNIYVVGTRDFYDADANEQSYFVQKISPSGTSLWYQEYFKNTATARTVNEAIVGSDDNLYFVGTEYTLPESLADSRVIKVDSGTGGIIWSDLLSVPDQNLILYDIAQDASNDIYVTGDVTNLVWPAGPHGPNDLFIAAYVNEFTDAEQRWRRQINLSRGSVSNTGFGVSTDSDNTLWLLEGEASFGYDSYVYQMDTNGDFK